MRAAGLRGERALGGRCRNGLALPGAASPWEQNRALPSPPPPSGEGMKPTPDSGLPVNAEGSGGSKPGVREGGRDSPPGVKVTRALRCCFPAEVGTEPGVSQEPESPAPVGRASEGLRAGGQKAGTYRDEQDTAGDLGNLPQQGTGHRARGKRDKATNITEACSRGTANPPGCRLTTSTSRMFCHHTGGPVGAAFLSEQETTVLPSSRPGSPHRPSCAPNNHMHQPGLPARQDSQAHPSLRALPPPRAALNPTALQEGLTFSTAK